jgi:glutaredoxin-related protein
MFKVSSRKRDLREENRSYANWPKIPYVKFVFKNVHAGV